MAESLRRSARRTTKKTSTYKVGDIVEVTRNDTIGRGRLVYRLTEGPTPNARWLVTFDHEPSWKDEELYERSFGKLVKNGVKTSGKSRKVKSSSRKKTSKTNSSSFKTSSSSEAEESRNGGGGNGSGGAGSPNHNSNSKKKVISFPENSSTLSEVDSPSSKDGKISAREQRSMRRQAKINEEATSAPAPTTAVTTTTSTNTTTTSGTKRKHAPPPIHSSKSSRPTAPQQPNKKARKETAHEEVVKVPMLTGTLYLYRGTHRRAEFVRRF